jgi:hypothetical protein
MLFSARVMSARIQAGVAACGPIVNHFVTQTQRPTSRL